MGRAEHRTLPALLLAVLGALPLARAAPVAPPAQRDPELRAVVQQAITQAQCFTDQYDSAVWYTLMEPKLRRFVKDDKERLEILQMALFEPSLAILDETDSGLDIDALRIVAEGVNAMRNPERAILVVTHYQRLLNYIVPDFVHVLAEGRIVKSGGKELALELEESGYVGIEEVVENA